MTRQHIWTETKGGQISALSVTEMPGEVEPGVSNWRWRWTSQGEDLAGSFHARRDARAIALMQRASEGAMFQQIGAL